LAVRPQGVPQALPPATDLRVTLSQYLPDEALKRLSQRGIRDVAFILVKLAKREMGARWNQRAVQFIDHRRLSDAGIAGHQYEFHPPLPDHPVKTGG
jgi:hypothetical protein